MFLCIYYVQVRDLTAVIKEFPYYLFKGFSGRISQVGGGNAKTCSGKQMADLLLLRRVVHRPCVLLPYYDNKRCGVFN